MTSLTQCKVTGLIEASRLRSTSGVRQLIKRLAELLCAVRVSTRHFFQNHFGAVQRVSINNSSLWIVKCAGEPLNQHSIFQTYLAHHYCQRRLRSTLVQQGRVHARILDYHRVKRLGINAVELCGKLGDGVKKAA